jgi:hypothetical protein
MGNIVTTIGHDIKVAAKDTGHVVVEIVTWLPKVEKVLASAIKDQPEIKQAVLDLVKKASVVAGDVSTDVSENGLNLAQDAQTLADAESFFAWFKSSFVPLVENFYGEIAADIK